MLLRVHMDTPDVDKSTALAEVLMTRNTFTRLHGFTPTQLTFGFQQKIPHIATAEVIVYNNAYRYNTC